MKTHQLICEQKGNFIEAEVSKQRVLQLTNILQEKLFNQKQTSLSFNIFDKSFKSQRCSLDKQNQRKLVNQSYRNKSTNNSCSNSFICENKQTTVKSICKSNEEYKKIVKNHTVNNSIDSKRNEKICFQKEIKDEKNRYVCLYVIYCY